MDIKTFKNLAAKLPANIAVLMRGPTGVGKSHMGKALATELGLDFLDVRGSTMDESQVSGIPDFETSKTAGVATFCLPSWYVRACREPVVLMLDELNRSMPQVMQSFFQIVLDRELGNNAEGEAVRLHPETRVIAAVNHGNEYDVNDMDPALLRRFWVVDLDPSSQDWIDWASTNDIDPLTIDFVRQHPEHLRVDPGSVEPGTVIPTPASWHRLDESLQYMGMVPSELAGTRPDGLYATASGFVGTEAAIAYSEFIARYERVISAEDVLEGRVDAERAKELACFEAERDELTAELHALLGRRIQLEGLEPHRAHRTELLPGMLEPQPIDAELRALRETAALRNDELEAQMARQRRAHATRLWCEEQLNDIAKVFANAKAKAAKNAKPKK